MDTESRPYTKLLEEFGKPVNFESKKPAFIAHLPNHFSDIDRGFALEEIHVRRDPNFKTFSNIPQMSKNTVNTERVSTNDRSMYHYEGGWPHDFNDFGEEKKRKIFIKKNIERTKDSPHDKFLPSLMKMCNHITDIIRENNQIDMFEEYFDQGEPEHNIEKLNVKTLMLFKDPSEVCKRSVSRISWHPDGPQSLAAAYSIMRFQKQPSNMDYQSYIWDLTNPNTPAETINPSSPIVTLAYNHRNVSMIGFGCYNGRVGCWDPRNGKKDPIVMSNIENSHHEPVIDLIWMSSKGGNEFVTCSTDGQVLWWDLTNLKEPTDSLKITETDQPDAKFIGATSLEYVSDHGPKFLIGTERGSIMMATKKSKNEAFMNYTSSFGLKKGRHLGPIYSIKRNPAFPNYFLSVGDWSASIWHEEEKRPIMRTRYHPSYLTDGCWAPKRSGLFFVTRRDGWLDIWDYLYRQNEVAFSHKVSDYGLTCVKLNVVTGSDNIGVTPKGQGKYAAIGDMNGTITLLELCPSLYEPQLHMNERSVIESIFSREKEKEKKLRTLENSKNKKKKKMEAKMANEQKKKAREDDPEKERREMNDIKKHFQQQITQGESELLDLYESDDEMKMLIQERMRKRNADMSQDGHHQQDEADRAGGAAGNSERDEENRREQEEEQNQPEEEDNNDLGGGAAQEEEPQQEEGGQPEGNLNEGAGEEENNGGGGGEEPNNEEDNNQGGGEQPAEEEPQPEPEKEEPNPAPQEVPQEQPKAAEDDDDDF